MGLRVGIRTKAGSKAGLGHLVRSLSLGEALRREGASVVLLCDRGTARAASEVGFEVPFVETEASFSEEELSLLEELSLEWVVVDSYEAPTSYLKALVERGVKVLLFDDNADVHPMIWAHLLVNGNVHAGRLTYRTMEGTKGLLGPTYLAMHPSYWEAYPEGEDGGYLLVTLGGGSTGGRMALLVELASDLGVPAVAVAGPAMPEEELGELKALASKLKGIGLVERPRGLKGLMGRSRAVICGCGTTVYEALTLKKPAVGLVVAQNQRLIGEALSELGLPVVDALDGLDLERLAFEVLRAFEEPSSARGRLERAFALFDGRGAIRVAREVLARGGRT